LVYQKCADMAIVLVLGNNTTDTADRCQELARENSEPCHGLIDHWPEVLENGWYYADVGTLRLSDLHDICRQVDQLILAHSDPGDYDDLESCLTTTALYEYYSQQFHRSVAVDNQLHIAVVDRFQQQTYWNKLELDISEVHTEKDFFGISQYLKNCNFQGTNIIVHFGSIADPDQIDVFAQSIKELAELLRSCNNRFVFIRTDQHMKHDPKVMDIMLKYPEFVFLHPDCFEDSTAMVDQIIWRWNKIYE